jgi:Subtilase family
MFSGGGRLSIRMRVMFRAMRLNGLFGMTLAISLALVGPLCGTAAAAASAPGPLAPPLATLARPAVASQPPAQQAEDIGVPTSGPGSLIRQGQRVLVEVRFESGALARLDDLREAEATVVSASRGYQTVTASIPPTALREAAAVPGVASLTPVPAPIVYATECEGGSVISEGVPQIHAEAARQAFGVNGEGVTVGVLSDSYDKSTAAATHASQDVLTKDLPGLANTCLGQQVPVEVRSDFSSPEATDEGRAMLQIVHDVAPAAKLAFATAFQGETAFAKSIEGLAAPVLSGGAGAKAIVDDVAYFEEPFFQDGPVAAAVDKVTAEGVTYLSAAGNDNLINGSGRNIASWEAPSFRDGGSCPAVIAETHCMDFNPGTAIDGTFGITVEPQQELVLDLQWAEPWEDVKTDLDAFLLNASGNTVLASATDDNIGTQKPVELLFWKNPSTTQSREVQLAVDHCFGGCNPGASATKSPRLKLVLLENGRGVSETQYHESKEGDVVGPTVYGHAGSASAIAVGAVPFSSSSRVEPYSSRGPVTHYFGPVGGGGAAAALPAAQVIAKPDAAATDCGRTTFFASEGPSGTWRFCGTSAAAPHAAGAVALMLQAAKSAGGGLDQPEPIRAALLRSAVAVGGFDACAAGAGLVEANGAIARLLAGPGTVPALACPPPAEAAEAREGVAPEGPIPTVVPTPTPPATPASPATAGPPRTTILKHPRKLIRTRSGSARVVFRFGSSQADATFLCKIDRRAFRACGSRISRRLGLGGHRVEAKAVSSAGLADATPAVFRFRVKRVS